MACKNRMKNYHRMVLLPKKQEKIEKMQNQKVSFVKVVFYCFHNNRNNRALPLIVVENLNNSRTP